MPEPTNTPSAPSCIISAASAGVAMPPAEKLTTGSLPASAIWVTRSSGARSSFAAVGSSAVLADVARHALEGHHRCGAGLLGDLGLLGGDDIHDHAALEHLGEPSFDPECGGIAHMGDPSERALRRAVGQSRIDLLCWRA